MSGNKRRKIECCFSCSRRHSNCHADCEDYRRERQELDERLAEIQQNRKREKNLMDYKLIIHPYKHLTRRPKK